METPVLCTRGARPTLEHLSRNVNQEAAEIRVIPERDDAQREVLAAIAACTEELIVLRPGGPRTQQQFALDEEVLERGVKCRILYQHTARANLGLRPLAQKLARHGGEVRTSSAGFERMLILDRRTAFVPTGAPDGDVPGAAMVTNPEVVQFLYRGFERTWSTAMSVEHAEYDEASVDIKVMLLRLMASGLKDEAIAQRLGMAPRTCRRHMSAIMAELDVTSRFQAGIKIASMGVLTGADTLPVQVKRSDAHPVW